MQNKHGFKIILVFALVAVFSSLLLFASIPVSAITIGVGAPNPSTPAAGSIASFAVTLNVTTQDLLPVSTVQMDIYNISNAAYRDTFTNLPVNTTAPAVTKHSTTDNSHTMTVLAAAGANWGSNQGSGPTSRWGYGTLDSGTTGNYSFGSGYGWGYSSSGNYSGNSNLTYSINWNVPATFPAGTYKAEIRINAGSTTGTDYTFLQSGATFTVTSTGGTPTITSISSSTGNNGSTIYVYGNNLTYISTIYFGGTPASNTAVNSSTQITAVVGTGSTGYVTGFSPTYGTISSPVYFTYTGSSVPTISAFSPTSGGYGSTVYVYGSNLSYISTIYFGGTPAQSTIVNSSTQITAVVGYGSTGYVTGFSSTYGTIASTLYFTYTGSSSTPTISSFSPTSGGYGTVVYIYGANLSYVTGVYFGGTAALSYTINSSAQITATVGSGSSGYVTVTSAYGTATSGAYFTYVPQIPPQYGGILKWLTPRAPGTPIGWPAESQIVSTFSMQLCLQTLLKEQIDGSLTPCLATSYAFNSDPADPSITFFLRQGVKFHDGTDFNAQAVKWNFDHVKNGGLFPGITNYWESIEVIDDYTLRVNLTAWSNRFIRAFFDLPTFIVSPSAYYKNGIDWMRWNMVGTGPFIQVDFQKDVVLKTVKNPNYWEPGKPYLDGVHLMYVTDELTRRTAFEAEIGDVMDCGLNTKVASELASDGYNIVSQPVGPLTLIPDSLNATSPWANIKVRQATEYGIDKAAISKTFGYGYTSPAYQVNNPNSMAYDPALPGRKYDPAKAKQLLMDAGYPNGFWTRIIAQNGRDQNEIVAIQAYLAAIGINAELQLMEPTQFNLIVTGTWDNALICFPLVQCSNPNVGFNSFFGIPPSLLQSLKKPDGWSTLLNTSLASPMPDPVLTRNCEDALYNDATVIPIFYQAPSFATANNIRETYLGSRGRPDLWEPQLAWLGQPAWTDTPLSLYPTSVGPIGIGQTFNLDIKTNVVGAQQVSGVDAFINFDPSRLEVVDADAMQAGIQINPGASLNTVLNNNVDNTGGLISYSAGKLGEPYPSGSFTVATIQFRTKTVTSAFTTPVTISLSGNSTTSIVDFGGTPIFSTHGDASVHIVPGAIVTFNVVLQGGSRPDSGWIVPLTVKLFTPGTTTPIDVLTATPVYTFNLTTAKSGSTAVAQTLVVAPGTYDISVVSPHCLINVERGVLIAIPSTVVNLGTLLEGNANDDNNINIQDFGILAATYGKSLGVSGYDARADFDRNGIINISDFGLLAANYGKNAPIDVTTP